MHYTPKLLSSRCICPVCWIAAAIAFSGVLLLLFHPLSPSAPSAVWLKFYVLAGSLLTSAWMGATGPTLLRHAGEVRSKEPVVILLGLLLFGGAPVILFPIMVSAWPILGLCALRQLRHRRP